MPVMPNIYQEYNIQLEIQEHTSKSSPKPSLLLQHCAHPHAALCTLRAVGRGNAA